MANARSKSETFDFERSVCKLLIIEKRGLHQIWQLMKTSVSATPKGTWDYQTLDAKEIEARRPYYIMPPIPPMSGADGASFFSSGLSATTASVVRNMAATEAAF